MIIRDDTYLRSEVRRFLKSPWLLIVPSAARFLTPRVLEAKNNIMGAVLFRVGEREGSVSAGRTRTREMLEYRGAVALHPRAYVHVYT